MRNVGETLAAIHRDPENTPINRQNNGGNGLDYYRRSLAFYARERSRVNEKNKRLKPEAPHANTGKHTATIRAAPAHMIEIDCNQSYDMS